MKADVLKERPFVERRSAALLATTQRAFWPLVKLLLHRGVGFQALAEALKNIFIRVAEAEFALEGKPATDSRISLLTGIHRRDVKRLRDEARARSSRTSAAAGNGAVAATKSEISLSARVIAVWTGLPDHLDADGKPKPLHRLARFGDDQSFESLVRSVSKDIRPRALLDEWLRRGAVTLDDEDRVHLNLDVFMAHKGLDEKAFYFGQNIHDHLAAIAHNITGNEPPFLERCVYYGQLTPASVAELAELAREEGMRSLQVLNRRAIELKARDAGEADARHRMNFGLYFYSAASRGPDGNASVADPNGGPADA
jgi:hypothetical protein